MAVSTASKSQKRDIKDYLAGVFESLPAALVLLDTKLRIVMVNGAAEVLTGYSRSELVRRRLGSIMSIANIRYITRILKERGRFEADGFITKLRTKDGSELPARLVVSPLRGESDALLGLLGVVSDLRAVKRIHGKLLEAERLEALSEIAVGLSHAINNPLCAILGNTQLLLLESDKLDASAVNKLRRIERDIARIKRIAERLPRITEPASREYVAGRKMIDIDASLPSCRSARRKRIH